MANLARSTPYAWPWDGDLAARRMALLVVDVVEEGRPGPPRGIARLGERLRAVGGLVVPVLCGWSRDASSPAGAVTTPGLDGFFESPLDAHLRRAGRTHLVIAGRWLETTVHSTMRSANDRGYECLLLEDLSIASDPALRHSALSSIHMSGGIFGATTDSDDLLSHLPLHS